MLAVDAECVSVHRDFDGYDDRTLGLDTFDSPCSSIPSQADATDEELDVDQEDCHAQQPLREPWYFNCPVDSSHVASVLARESVRRKEHYFWQDAGKIDGLQVYKYVKLLFADLFNMSTYWAHVLYILQNRDDRIVG